MLGVEPAANVAEAARAKGITTEVEFLAPTTGTDIAATHGRADLVVANNVFAHVPDLRGFAQAWPPWSKTPGSSPSSFPTSCASSQRRQFDTIYHEHYSYLTLATAPALGTAGLVVVDVDEIETHGGSLRVYARPEVRSGRPSTAVKEVLDAEAAAGLTTLAGYAGFAAEVLKSRATWCPSFEAARHGRRRRLRRTGQGQHTC